MGTIQAKFLLRNLIAVRDLLVERGPQQGVRHLVFSEAAKIEGAPVVLRSRDASRLLRSEFIERDIEPTAAPKPSGDT